MTRLRWTRGDAALQREIDRQLDTGEAQCLHDNVRRAVFRLRSAHGDVIVKQFRVESRRHALRERAKERLERAAMPPSGASGLLDLFHREPLEVAG